MTHVLATLCAIPTGAMSSAKPHSHWVLGKLCLHHAGRYRLLIGDVCCFWPSSPVTPPSSNVGEPHEHIDRPLLYSRRYPTCLAFSEEVSEGIVGTEARIMMEAGWCGKVQECYCNPVPLACHSFSLSLCVLKYEWWWPKLHDIL